MHTRSRSGALLASLAALAIGSTGCIKQILLEGQIDSTRKASTAVDTLQDYEVANAVAYSGISTMEGLHYLAPDNENALFMLTKSWAGVAFGFIEDEMEKAEDAGGIDSPLFLYQQLRAKVAYERAIFYGIQLLEKKNPGFQAATKNDDTMRAWLKGFDDPEADTPKLFWTAQAWMSKVNVAKDDPAIVSELFIGVAIMERAVELDETFLYGSGHTALGAYHARSPMAELDESKKHFDKAIEISGGKALMGKLQLAAKYYCAKGDKENYVKLLTEVVEAGDLLPQGRLTNVIAKRKAKRYLSAIRMKSCGF